MLEHESFAAHINRQTLPCLRKAEFHSPEDSAVTRGSGVGGSEHQDFTE